jgi:hypothetical protein
VNWCCSADSAQTVQGKKGPGTSQRQERQGPLGDSARAASVISDIPHVLLFCMCYICPSPRLQPAVHWLSILAIYTECRHCSAYGSAYTPVYPAGTGGCLPAPAPVPVRQSRVYLHTSVIYNLAVLGALPNQVSGAELAGMHDAPWLCLSGGGSACAVRCDVQHQYLYKTGLLHYCCGQPVASTWEF